MMKNAELHELLLSKHMTISTAESCTGGMIAHLITSMVGSSDYYKGSVVSYANEVKMNVLGVEADALAEFGAVSQAVVVQMAEGVRRLMHTDIAVSTSGIAGPGGGTDEKPVGTVWMAVATPSATFAHCFHFDGDRLAVIDQAANAALHFVINSIAQNQ